jgi:PIN domain nuclease of toxin-antitoxin system
LNEAVLDSSAVIAVLRAEPGAEKVAAVLPGALISAVNLAEIMTKLCEQGMSGDEARLAIETTGVEVVDFNDEQACLTGRFRNATRSAGLSLGDRACLALAHTRRLPAITADTAWARLVGFDVVLIRGSHAT